MYVLSLGFIFCYKISFVSSLQPQGACSVLMLPPLGEQQVFLVVTHCSIYN